MSFVVRTFLRAGVGFAIVGMGLGIAMAARHDFALAPVHAHVNLLGWVSMLLYGLVYRAFPEAAESRAALAHLWLAIVGLLLMAPGIALLVTGHEVGVVLTLPGELMTIASMLLFATLVVRVTRAAPALAPAPVPRRALA